MINDSPVCCACFNTSDPSTFPRNFSCLCTAEGGKICLKVSVIILLLVTLLIGLLGHYDHISMDHNVSHVLIGLSGVPLTVLTIYLVVTGIIYCALKPKLRGTGVDI